MPPTRNRRAYILILVLGLTALVSALALEFAASSATVLPASTNRAAGVRAQYLAESGAALAAHYLACPPRSVPLNDYWRGASGIAVDATADYVNVGVTRSTSDPHLYVINALGVALGTGGSIAGKHSVLARAVARPQDVYAVAQTLLGRSSMVIPQRVTINGDALALGNLMNLGTVTGTLSATATATSSGTTAPRQIVSYAAAVPLPPGDPARYMTYRIRGTDYTGTFFSSNSATKLAADSLNAADLSATNPGRIIVPPNGHFAITENGTVINGTLVVRGDLRLDANVTFNAQPNYPALVVTGNIVFTRDARLATVNGMVISAGTISDGARLATGLVINGPVITNGLSILGAGSTMQFNSDVAKAQVWDLETVSPRRPVTFVDWDDG